VGVPSTFNDLTTITNAATFNSGYVSTITGLSITYNAPVVIVRYKTTKTVIIQVPSYGFLKYNEDNVWEVSNELQTIINGHNSYSNLRKCIINICSCELAFCFLSFYFFFQKIKICASRSEDHVETFLNHPL